jgi:hypothetical protein
MAKVQLKDRCSIGHFREKWLLLGYSDAADWLRRSTWDYSVPDSGDLALDLRSHQSSRVRYHRTRMHRRIRVIGALLPVFALAQPINISGRVIDDTGKPLPRVDVMLKLAGIEDITATAQTDPKGRYSFSGVLPNFYDLYFEKKNFNPATLGGLKTVVGMDSTPSDVVMHEFSFFEPSAPIPYDHAELPGTPTMEATTDDPFPTPLCETVKDPPSFNGKMVTLRGRVQIAFENFELSATGCPARKIDGIWLEYGKGSKRQPTIWCCGEVSPRDAEVTLIQNKEFHRFHRYLTAQRRTKGCYFGQCYLYSVTATLTGRLDAVPTVTCPDGKSQCPEHGGFGHFGVFSARLVIQSVADVIATPLGPSAH